MFESFFLEVVGLVLKSKVTLKFLKKTFIFPMIEIMLETAMVALLSKSKFYFL